MNATFHDMEQVANPMNGRILASPAQVAMFFRSLAGRKPFMFELRGDNGFILTIGFAGDRATVQYSNSEGLPPYWMAVADDVIDEGEFLECLAGGTPTPIPRRFSLRLEQAQEIVQDFLSHGERPNIVEWEEI